MEKEKVDYGKTLNLPQTDFAMKANLPQREPVIQEKWEKEDLYNKALEKNKGNKSFILHDGPPYANGDIHLGHTLNKVLKDMINRYKTMNGFYAPYVPGWDTHGLPIELQAIKKLGIKKNSMSTVEFRRQCRDYALTQVERQTKQFKRLGVIGDFDNPYLTLRPEFEAKQIEIFGKMAEKGYIYKGLKPVYWCSSCETALAEAEVEYADKTSTSIYVRFNVTDDKGMFKNLGLDLSKVYYIIWTTTPWTLPANLGIALGPEIEYAIVKEKDSYYVVAKELLESVKSAIGFEEAEIIAEFNGLDLEGQVCKHPFIDRDSKVIVGDHVTLESGTGCVHTAPGHGKEDFEVGQKYGLEVINPVDNRGRFTSEAGKYEGLKYTEGNDAILEDIRESGALLADSKINHSYPHCWRCKKPIIFRATEQWFASIDGFKEAAVKEIKNVKWIPEWGEERITSMVSDRADWCISRQRVWGVPIPIFYCEKCNKEIINTDTISKISSIFKEKGSDAWFEMDASELIPEGTVCECGCSDFRKEMDIMDVWFDSGSSHAGVLEARENLSWPADIYLEGNDQYRGWFQSSLLTSVAAKGIAPYKTVITHGMVVDGEGKKMSKSLGNGIDPMEVIKENGADILRLWVSSADYKSDVRISKNILKQLSEGYRKIRNTARYMIGNLSDFDPTKDKVSYEDMNELDKWAVLKLQKLINGVTNSYENYQFHAVYHDIHNFCVVDMSNFYLDIIKDRLYTEKTDSSERRAAQTVMYDVLNALVKMISPIMSFTSEEIWNFIKHEDEDNVESVLLSSWPKASNENNDSELEAKWDKMREIRTEVSKALELARREKIVGNSLNAKIYINADGEVYEFLNGMREYLETVFIVSQLELTKGLENVAENAYKSEEIKDLAVLVEQAPGEKCERCWIFSSTIGEDSNHPTLCARCSSVIE
ncbi:isoleucine--tRNA ligase [Clostridium cylindrosporum]|uniref:Isoleucine--tRNA ligase n=1 Tax=Clostridium cylindrosporum DSM 605 TaxID=1121307 RepID=A0A0J8D5M7_CLOCY|nr:isoleucine--tRNA ligase [Clostridium cylindrosporum]KMT21435.1 isoleucine--tRNA ligase IleS [Clostridium cylindrosporum DSM 605]